MARDKVETEQKHMDRLRVIRGLPPQREEMMARTRAAVAFINGGQSYNHEGLKLSAFMSIFHPEVSDQDVRQMIRDARK